MPALTPRILLLIAGDAARALRLGALAIAAVRQTALLPPAPPQPPALGPLAPQQPAPGWSAWQAARACRSRPRRRAPRLLAGASATLPSVCSSFPGRHPARRPAAPQPPTALLQPVRAAPNPHLPCPCTGASNRRDHVCGAAASCMLLPARRPPLRRG
jgi:hypothetical protein